MYDLTRKVIYLSPYFDFITRNKIIKLSFLFETHPLTVFPSNNKKSQDYSLVRRNHSLFRIKTNLLDTVSIYSFILLITWNVDMNKGIPRPIDELPVFANGCVYYRFFVNFWPRPFVGQAQLTWDLLVCKQCFKDKKTFGDPRNSVVKHYFISLSWKWLTFIYIVS